MVTAAEKDEIFKAYNERFIIIETRICRPEETKMIEMAPDAPRYSFNFDEFDYRVKPNSKTKSRKVYLNGCGIKNRFVVYGSKAMAEVLAGNEKPEYIANPYIELTPELEKLAKEAGLL